MRCPNCGKDSALEVHVDSIRCMDCNSVSNVSYCVCENCSFAYRLNNGHYLDGGLPDENAVKLQKAVESELNKIVNEEAELEKMPLSDYIAHLHRCIRCNSLAIAKEDGLYKCAECGFGWEAA